ncbi:MAG: hypothetical protein IPM16_23745 [Chloroflexi bacterium]|nr:hypothetical protein [Chloroflexota bacterium]
MRGKLASYVLGSMLFLGLGVTTLLTPPPAASSTVTPETTTDPRDLDDAALAQFIVDIAVQQRGFGGTIESQAVYRITYGQWQTILNSFVYGVNVLPNTTPVVVLQAEGEFTIMGMEGMPGVVPWRYATIGVVLSPAGPIVSGMQFEPAGITTRFIIDPTTPDLTISRSFTPVPPVATRVASGTLVYDPSAD